MREMTWWEQILCWWGRHDWCPWQLQDDKHPIVRMWACRRCGRIESV